MSEYDNEQKFWDDLRASLQEHEEAYPQGAWEKFQSLEASKSSENPVPLIVPIRSEGSPHAPGASIAPATPRSRTRPMYWMGSVAACLLILLGTWMFWPTGDVDLGDVAPQIVENGSEAAPRDVFQKDVSQNSPITVTESPASGNSLAALESSTPVEILTPVENSTYPQNLTATNFGKAVFTGLEEPLLDQSVGLLTAELTASSLTQQPEPFQNQYPGSEETADPEYLIAKIGNKVENPWQFGLQMSSAVTTDRLNYGGGLQVSYRITDKISINSGISIGKMGVNRAKTDFLDHVSSRIKGESADIAQIEVANYPNEYLNSDVSPGGSSIPGKSLSANMLPSYHSRTLLGSTSQLVTMDIPLDVKINWTRNFYTSIGVSFVGILDENRYNHYREGFSVESLNGVSMRDQPQNLQYEVQFNTVKSLADAQPLEGQKYATGYLNFSVGRQVAVYKNFQIGLEPFIKMPMGGLRRSEMNFTNVGLRLISGF